MREIELYITGHFSKVTYYNKDGSYAMAEYEFGGSYYTLNEYDSDGSLKQSTQYETNGLIVPVPPRPWVELHGKY